VSVPSFKLRFLGDDGVHSPPPLTSSYLPPGTTELHASSTI
jgi:hypothetical protein